VRILYFTDMHGNVKAFNHMLPRGVPARHEEFVNTFTWLKQMKEKHNCSRCVFGGDLFDSVCDLKMPYFNMMHRGMWSLDCSMDLIDGNHDKYDAIYKAIDPFKPFARVHSVPEAYYDPSMGHKLVFLPFQRDPEVATSWVNELTKEEVPTLVFIHQGIQGYVIDDCAINKSVFAKPHIKKVFGGHYHFRIETGIVSGPKKIIYPGSVVSLHFDDSFTGKYCVIYDTDTDELIWEENPSTSFFIQMPQKQVLESMEQLEGLTSVSFIRILKTKDEELSVPMSFLLKFRGYDIGEEKIDPDAKFKNEQQEQSEFDYASHLKEMSKTASGDLSYDLTHEQYKTLVLNGNEDGTLVERATQEKLDEVLQSTYLLGKT
jgi:DNA repair exonuclease SbcCD nuclease subunit